MTEKFNKPFGDMVSTNISDMTQKEHDAYLAYVKEKNGGTLDGVTDIVVEMTSPNDDQVAISYHVNEEKFERIRRITGYLVGTTDRWNNAKQAEERDRRKHA